MTKKKPCEQGFPLENQLVMLQNSGADFADITDYIVLLVYLMRQMGFTKTECKRFIAGYESTIEHFRSELPFNVYSGIIKTSARSKLIALRQFLRQ